ncbi:thiamine pyrophosphokinase [Aliiruegeria lutimaris]|uniref:Thiamine diphosphokinase n=2 Tax=Aliiruegeria lutimaris TaxID=571298 RepID=A0A1G8MF78_9RHOB|nr:thiamine diphosphokinase [Aliiruegeria lutimaris]SDI66614.1 thiamine pyrophosphokinase [Aliiruegeria lutimaris]
MNDVIVSESCAVTLLGGGKVNLKDLREALRLAPSLVAADGGATFAMENGFAPVAVIGDMDSIPVRIRADVPVGRFHEVSDQDSTDFDKALRNIDAPLILGVGFLGRRVDHQLANFNVLARRFDRRCILVGKHDVVFAAPCELELPLAPLSRVSLFPMAPVSGRSRGLNWEIDGLDMTPNGVIGTSNHVRAGHGGPVSLAFDRPGMLVIVPRASLNLAISALERATPFSPAR